MFETLPALAPGGEMVDAAGVLNAARLLGTKTGGL
jgi:hypothetical protein